MTEKIPAAAPRPPDAGMRREIWVGVFVVVGIVSTLIALFTLTDASTFRGRYVVLTEVPDAGGVRRGDPVQVLGVNIGRVQSFEISNDGVTIRLEIEGEYKIPADSRLEVRSSGLLGGMMMNVVPGESDEDARAGALLPGATAPGFLDSAERIGSEAEDALARVKALLSEENVNHIGASTTELHSLMRELSATATEQRAELKSIEASLTRAAATAERALGSAERTAGRLDRATASADLEQALSRVVTISERLDNSTASFERSSKALETILARIEQGEGMLGRMTVDATLYDSANEALASMRDTSGEFRRLAEDIRVNPKRYVRLSLF